MNKAEREEWEDGEICLWFLNDEGLYNYAKACKSGTQLWNRLQRDGMTRIHGIYASKRRCNLIMDDILARTK